MIRFSLLNMAVFRLSLLNMAVFRFLLLKMATFCFSLNLPDSLFAFKKGQFSFFVYKKGRFSKTTPPPILVAPSEYMMLGGWSFLMVGRGAEEIFQISHFFSYPYTFSKKKFIPLQKFLKIFRTPTNHKERQTYTKESKITIRVTFLSKSPTYSGSLI